jgi:hygromycin-B 7''-O-kinase
MEASMVDLQLGVASRLVRAGGVESDAASVLPLFGGNNSAVFEVVCENGASVVVKIYSDALHWKMRKEAFVYGILAADGPRLPIGQVLLADDSKDLVPQNVLLMTKLPGQHVYSLVSELTDEDLRSIYREIGALLRRLHDNRLPLFGYIGVDGIGEGFSTNQAYMEHQFGRKLEQFQQLGGDKRLHRRIERFVEDGNHCLADCTTPTFCHNGCHEGNVLIVRDTAGWRISGLLDLENALAGDPLMDISKTYSYSSRRDDSTLAALTEGYGEMRSDWREALNVYLLYHALELWDWFAENGTTDPLPHISEDISRLCSGEPLLPRA